MSPVTPRSASHSVCCTCQGLGSQLEPCGANPIAGTFGYPKQSGQRKSESPPLPSCHSGSDSVRFHPHQGDGAGTFCLLAAAIWSKGAMEPLPWTYPIALWPLSTHWPSEDVQLVGADGTAAGAPIPPLPTTQCVQSARQIHSCPGRRTRKSCQQAHGPVPRTNTKVSNQRKKNTSVNQCLLGTIYNSIQQSASRTQWHYHGNISPPDS